MANLVIVHRHSKERDEITINADQIVWMERKTTSAGSSWTNVYFTGDRNVMVEEKPEDLQAMIGGFQRR